MMPRCPRAILWIRESWAVRVAIRGITGVLSGLRTRTWTDPTHFNSMVARQQFLWDVGNGTLPDVSWVIPSAPISDHPPANITLGEWWITDVVDAVMNSRYLEEHAHSSPLG